jgi:hypothetical protein
MILTRFAADVFLRFLQNVLVAEDSSKDFYYRKADQVPPFNMTLLFTNESGMASYRRLLGVETVTDGVVYSTNDLYSEQSVSWVAADMTPLLPFAVSALYQPAPLRDRRRDGERTVKGPNGPGPSPIPPASSRAHAGGGESKAEMSSTLRARQCIGRGPGGGCQGGASGPVWVPRRSRQRVHVRTRVGGGSAGGPAGRGGGQCVRAGWSLSDPASEFTCARGR